MKLWLLEPLYPLPEDEDPWSPGYDQAFGFVVAAKDERNAREIAADKHGDEGSDAWLQDDCSSCRELKAEELDPGVVLRDFVAG